VVDFFDAMRFVYGVSKQNPTDHITDPLSLLELANLIEIAELQLICELEILRNADVISNQSLLDLLDYSFLVSN